MKKFLKTILAAASISSIAISSTFDLELAGHASVWDISNSLVTTTDNTSTSNSVMGLLGHVGGRLSFAIRVAESVSVGIASGYRFNMPLPENVRDNNNEKKELSDNERRQSIVHSVPIAFALKHDMFQPIDRMNIYLAIRVGMAITMANNVGLFGDGSQTAKRNLLGAIFDFGFGLEYWGAQFELGYMYQNLGVVNIGENTNVSVKSNSLYVSLGYRLSF